MNYMALGITIAFMSPFIAIGGYILSRIAHLPSYHQMQQAEVEWKLAEFRRRERAARSSTATEAKKGKVIETEWRRL